MRKTIAVLGSAFFFAVAPSSVAGLIPWWITGWEFRPPFFAWSSSATLRQIPRMALSFAEAGAVGRCAGPVAARASAAVRG